MSKIKVQLEKDDKIWKFYIEPNWRKIKDFEKNLKEVFDIPNLAVLDGDGYIHPNSNIIYITKMAENDEIVTVKVKQEVAKPKKRNPFSVTAVEVEEETNYPKKKKRTTKFEEAYKFLVENNITKEEEQDFTEISINFDNDNCMAKPKKRKRTKKKLGNSLDNSKSDVEQEAPKKEKAKINSLAQQNEGKHLHFDKTGSLVDEDENGSLIDNEVKEKKKYNLVFINHIERLDCKHGRVIKPKNTKLISENNISTDNIIMECSNTILNDNNLIIGPKLPSMVTEDHIVNGKIEFVNDEIESSQKLSDNNIHSNDISDTNISDMIHFQKEETPKIIIKSNKVVKKGYGLFNASLEDILIGPYSDSLI